MFWSSVHVSFSARMVFRPNLWCCFTWWMYRELLVCAWNLGQAAELTDDFSDLIDRLSKKLVNARKYYASLSEGNTLLWLEMASSFFIHHNHQMINSMAFHKCSMVLMPLDCFKCSCNYNHNKIFFIYL